MNAGNRRRWPAALGAVALLASTGCVSVFHGQAEVQGTEQRLVVGYKDGFPGPSAKIWVEENGSFQEVTVVGGD